MNTYTYIANVTELLPDMPADSIISRTIYTDEHVKAVLFGFAAGQELSEHTASQPAILHILNGEANLTLGDDSLEARAGAWIHMPPLLRHSINAKTPVVMLLLLIKTAIPQNPDDPPR
ncbi:MAG: cupin domain-containing protein [candidate division NC10 bacterium]|jgi:quercetin dioxygenase-like cupin family protein